MDKTRIRLFLMELVLAGLRYPGKTGFGSPISYLIEKMFRSDVSGMVDRIVGDFTKDTNEWRLNGVGLKMWWRIEDRKFTVRIGGDQVRDYPEFVEAANRLIKICGYERR